VIDALDEIPSVGESSTTELGSFEVVAMDGYAIETLHVRLFADDTPPPHPVRDRSERAG
jgi:CBS domain containing-hemolysin-like protein